MFLSRYVNHFINQFLCVHESKQEKEKQHTSMKKDFNESLHQEKEIISDATKSCGLGNNNKLYVDECCIKKDDVFRYKNIYFIEYNEDIAKVENIKKNKKEANMLSDYLYENIQYNRKTVNVDNSNMEGNLVGNLTKIKMYMKMDYQQFVSILVRNEKFETAKIREIYFLLSLVCIFYNLRKEGINKIFTILLDVYKNAHRLVKEKKKMSMKTNIEMCLYLDFYPYTKKKTEESGEKENKKESVFFSLFEENKEILELEQDDNIKHYKKNIYRSNRNEKSHNYNIYLKDGLQNEETSLKDTYTHRDDISLTNKQEYCTEDVNKIKNIQGIMCNNSNMIYGIEEKTYSNYSDEEEEEEEEDYDDDAATVCKVNNEQKEIENNRNRQNIREGISLSEFLKQKMHENCNELMKLFILYYINRIYYNVESYVQCERWLENKKEKVVSTHFIYILKEIHKIYYLLSVFFDSKIKSSTDKTYSANYIFAKVEKELEQVCKTYENDPNYSNMTEAINNQKHLEMYMYKLYMLKMKDYKKNIQLNNEKVVFIIIKVLFKNFTELIRTSYLNDNGFNKLKIDFFFYFYCLKFYIPQDDENVLFVILNEVLLNAKERTLQTLWNENKEFSKMGGENVTEKQRVLNSPYHVYLLENVEVDMKKNKSFILDHLKQSS